MRRSLIISLHIILSYYVIEHKHIYVQTTLHSSLPMQFQSLAQVWLCLANNRAPTQGKQLIHPRDLNCYIYPLLYPEITLSYSPILTLSMKEHYNR